MKCPRCHEGEFYEGHPYKYSTMGKVQKECSECHLKFNLEPSFYFGSYYVTYALGVALFILVGVLTYLFVPNADPKTILISIFVFLALLSPLFYALSKTIWINFFVKYDKGILRKRS